MPNGADPGRLPGKTTGRKGVEMFGMGVTELYTLGIGVGLIFIGILGLLIPYFIYRISINVAGMRETIEAMHGMIKNNIDADKIIELNDLVEKH